MKRIDPSLVRELYESGLGTVEIAQRIGATATGVNGVLRRAGVAIRSGAEAMRLIKESGRWQTAIHQKCDFNEYDIRGDVAVLICSGKSGRLCEVLVDLADLPTLQAHGRRWYVVRRKHTSYARASDGHARMVYLHQFLFGGSSRDLPVDHISHDGLDNRRQNLRVVTRSGNMLNNSGARKKAKSGVRGVTKHRSSGSWIARARSEYLGSFPTKEQAVEAVRRRLLELGVPASSLAKTMPPQTGLLPCDLPS